MSWQVAKCLNRLNTAGWNLHDIDYLAVNKRDYAAYAACYFGSSITGFVSDRSFRWSR